MTTTAVPPSAEVALLQRLERLEAMEAIRALKARYAALADQKYTSRYERVPDDEMARVARLQAECFTADAVWDGGSDFGATLAGREALAGWFTRSPWCFAVHYYGSPFIEVEADGARANAQWRLWQIALRDDTRRAVLLAAVTSERYERQPDGGWLQSRMRFDSIHMLPVGDLPLPLVTSLVTSLAATAAMAPNEDPHHA